MSERVKSGAVQDTGNPVMDTTANIIMNIDASWTREQMIATHEIVRGFFEQEPNRVNKKKPQTMAQMAASARN